MTKIEQKQEKIYKLNPDSSKSACPALDKLIDSASLFNAIQNSKKPLDPDYALYSKVNDKNTLLEVTGLSKELIKTLMGFEGFESDKYSDVSGVSTIGWGHNVDADTNYSYGSKLAQHKAYELFAKDLLKVKRDIKSIIEPDRLNQLNKNQYEALVELFYNVGAENIKDKNIIKHINSGELEKAACEFDFINTKGKVHSHLCERRIYDTNKFCSGKHSEQTYQAIKSIYDRGLESIEEKYEKASFFKKPYYAYVKYSYLSSQKPIIDKAESSIVK